MNGLTLLMSRAMGRMSRRGLTWVAFLLVVLAVAQTASADMASVASSGLSDFVIFSGGSLSVDAGYETEIGGHTWITGNIGSNQDLFMQGNPLTGYPALLEGSAYTGGKLTFGQDLTVGTSSLSQQVVANGAATIGSGVNIYGTLDAASVTLGSSPTPIITGGYDTSATRDTFALITMPAATVFTAGGADQTVTTGQGNSLTLAAGTYGSLATSSQNQNVYLSSGSYYFDDITTQGGFDLYIDLTSGDPINIYVVGDVGLAGNQTLWVKGAGTGVSYVPLDQAPQLASLIYLETGGLFSMIGGDTNNHNIWGGTVYSTDSGLGIDLGQYLDWYGAAYAFDSFDTADHGKWTYVPLDTAVVPVPGAALLGVLGLSFAGGWLRRRSAP